MTRTLVAYASKRGSTEEVARAIAGRLRDAGQHVDVRAADLVEDVAGYDGVVLGGALYAGRWHGDARGFVRRHRDALRVRPFAVFALGPLTLEEEQVAGSRKQLSGALERLEIEPTVVTVFGGAVDPAKLRFPFNRMPASDARDWAAIGRWADAIAHELEQRPAPAPALG